MTTNDRVRTSTRFPSTGALLGVLSLGATTVAGLALGRAVTSPSLAIILTATLGFGLRIVAETLMAREGLAAEVQLGHRVAPVVDAAVTSPDAPAPHDIVVLEDQIINGARLEVLRGSLVATPLALGLLYVFSGWLGLLCVVGLLVASVPLYVITGRRASAGVDAYTQRRSALSRQQLRVLRSANELRALGASDFAVDSVAAASHAEHETTTAFLRRSIGSSLVTDFIAGVSIGLVAMVVGFGILGGRESLAHALGALFVATELVTRIRRYGGEFHRRDDSQRALEAMCSIEPTAATSDGGLARREAGTTLAELDNVEVGHLASPLSLTVKANSRWVLRGASGVGKSTVLNCLVGHDTARSGRVTVPTCRVGIVRAASPLLPLTVLDNVTLRVARDDEAKDVLISLGVSEDLFDRQIRDGRELSDGERVRVLLARCLVTGCDLLVLDDVAALLDEDSRAAVRSTLERSTSLAVVEASASEPLLRTATILEVQVRS